MEYIYILVGSEALELTGDVAVNALAQYEGTGNSIQHCVAYCERYSQSTFANRVNRVCLNTGGGQVQADVSVACVNEVDTEKTCPTVVDNHVRQLSLNGVFCYHRTVQREFIENGILAEQGHLCAQLGSVIVCLHYDGSIPQIQSLAAYLHLGLLQIQFLEGIGTY